MSRPSGFKHSEETKAKMRDNHPRSGRSHTDEEKEQVAEKMREWHRNHEHPRKGKKASDETRKKMSLARQGNQNSNWKGGLTKLIRGIRRSPEYYQWRKAVLERDNGTCRDCGSSANVNAHHIKPIIDYPQGIFEEGNGLSLCEDCHKSHTSWQRLGRGKIKSKRQI